MPYYFFPHFISLGILGGIAVFILWSLVWQGLALWLTARRGQWGWFLFFLLVHTGGIAEIIYLLVTNGFQEIGLTKKNQE